MARRPAHPPSVNLLLIQELLPHVLKTSVAALMLKNILKKALSASTGCLEMLEADIGLEFNLEVKFQATTAKS